MSIKSTFTLFCFFIFSLAAKSQVMDQSHLEYKGGLSARTLAGYSIFQSFTAEITGTLVEIQMGVFNPIDGSGILKIYEGCDTTGALLQTTEVVVYCYNNDCFAKLKTRVPVVANQVYTFRFIPGQGIPDPYGVQCEVNGTYQGGDLGIIDPSGMYFPDWDMVFKTFVIPARSSDNLDQGISDSTAYLDSNAVLLDSLSESFETKITLTIIDSRGQTVLKIEDSLEQALILSKSQLEKGMYIIKITEGTKVILSSKFAIEE